MGILRPEMLQEAGIKRAIRRTQARKVWIKPSSTVCLYRLEFCGLIWPGCLTRVCVGRLKRLDVLAG